MLVAGTPVSGATAVSHHSPRNPETKRQTQRLNLPHENALAALIDRAV